MSADNVVGIAQAFVKHYYTIFDTSRDKLSSLYQNSSKMTFEGQAFLGQTDIVAKLTALPFKKVVHQIKSADAQPSGCGGIIVLVVGELKVDESPNPLKFSQCFHLMPTQKGSSNYWVHNDMFRLNYG